MKVDDNMMKMDAEIAFIELKRICLALEARGYRPQLIVHGNGMPDKFRVDPTHATTPAIEAIRQQNRAARHAA
jgi:hypothetical protein